MASVNLEAILAGVTGAAHNHVLAVDVECLEIVEQDVLDRYAEHLDHCLLGLRTLNGNLAVIEALVGNLNVKAFGVLHDPCHVLVDIRCVDHEEELIVVHLVDEQVIYRTAILAAHHAVENLAVGGTGHVVYEYMVDEFLCFGTFHADLTHVADVENAHFLTDCIVLVGYAFVLNGHVIAREGRHLRAQIYMTVMKTRDLDLFFHVLNILDKGFILLFVGYGH